LRGSLLFDRFPREPFLAGRRDPFEGLRHVRVDGPCIDRREASAGAHDHDPHQKTHPMAPRPRGRPRPARPLTAVKRTATVRGPAHSS
jgi:hypothetical protein